MSDKIVQLKTVKYHAVRVNVLVMGGFTGLNIAKYL